MLYYGVDRVISGQRFFCTAADDRKGAYQSAVKVINSKTVPFGITNLDMDSRNIGKTFRIDYYDTDLLNREYAWIAMVYMIKHVFYLIETLYLIQYKRFVFKPHMKSMDLLTPFFNASLWLIWALFGWLNSGDQIFGGMYERFQKDVIYMSGVYTQEQLNQRNDAISLIEQGYRDSLGWNWLWIPTFIVFFLNMAIFVYNLMMKRSSAYHGQALSTLVIPAQLLFLDLFIKGVWITSNAVNLSSPQSSTLTSTYSLFQSYYNAKEYLYADYFDARWVFWIIYLAAYFGIVFAILCFIKGFHDIKFCRPIGIKYCAYSVFFVAAFVWVLCMDLSLYQYFYQVGTALVASQIVCFVSIMFVACASIWEKFTENEYYFEKHNFWADWDTDYFAENYPHFTKRPTLKGIYELPAHPKLADGQPKLNDLQEGDNKAIPSNQRDNNLEIIKLDDKTQKQEDNLQVSEKNEVVPDKSGDKIAAPRTLA